MENETDFDKYPKLSIKSLVDENIIERVSLIQENNEKIYICLEGRIGIKVNLLIGKNTSDKIRQNNFNENEILNNGYIALIAKEHSVLNLRIYITEYNSINQIF
jgi:hypothetical protein